MSKSSSFLKQVMPLVYAILVVPAFTVLLLVLLCGVNKFERS
jgi:hypothetical protein